MAEWVVWYSDGTSFSSDDGGPADAPRQYVQCVAVADEGCGRYVMSEQNYYCWHYEASPPQWVPHDFVGLLQYLAAPGEKKTVLSGYWIARDRYAALRTRALKDDLRLPPVTAGPPRDPEGI